MYCIHVIIAITSIDFISEAALARSMSRGTYASPPPGGSRTGCGMERNGAVSTVVLRKLMSGPLRADIMVSFGKPARSLRCAGSKQGQRAAGGRMPLDGRHLDRPEPAISIFLFLSMLRIEIYICVCIYMYSDLIKVRSSDRPSAGHRRVAPPPGRPTDRSIP